MVIQIGRREFIATLGAATAVAWPLVARAQQPGRPVKIGVLYPGLASILPSRVTVLRDGLQRLGYREPDNFELVLRSADGDPTRVIPLAMELVGRKVDVILAANNGQQHAAGGAVMVPGTRCCAGEGWPVKTRLIYRELGLQLRASTATPAVDRSRAR
jgi:hypothetical protein